MVTVALDAMGGDHGLDATVDGAAMLSREDTDLHVILVGDVAAISRRLEHGEYDPSRLTVVEARGCVAMDAKPQEALDRMPDCSVAVAARLVADGTA